MNMEAFAVISYDHHEQQSFVDYVVAENSTAAEQRVAHVRGDHAFTVDCLTLAHVDAIRRALLQDHRAIEEDWQRQIEQFKSS